MSEDSLSFSQYAAMLRRRRSELIWAAVLLLLLTVGVAFGLPPVYRSTGTILIEQQEIPAELIRTTVNSYAAERIEVISQQVMASSNLKSILSKHDLLPEQAPPELTQAAVQEMRDSITREIVNADVTDPQTGRAGQATIAFTVSYDHSDPAVAKAVATELVNLFLQQNAATRTERADTTSAFLAAETERLGQDVAALEAKLAVFKRENVDRLPGSQDATMDFIDRTEREIESARIAMRDQEQRRATLQSQLLQVDPYLAVFDSAGQRVLSPTERLKALEAEYATAAARYSNIHPEISRLRREIDTLRQQLGVGPDSRSVAEELTRARAELAQAQDRYVADHPDILRLARTVDSIEAKLARAPTQAAQPATPTQPTNPAYISVQGQVQSGDIAIASERERIARLQTRLAEYERRATQIPAVEADYLNLARDYDNAKAKYQEMKEKLLQAEIAGQMEKESKGERFSLIEPPALPALPESPNRPGIMVLGTTLALAGALGVASVAEFRDPAVYTARQISSILRAPPLAVVGYIPDERDRERQRRRRRALIALAVLLLIAAVIGVLYLFAIPLDSLIPGLSSSGA